mgnify:CR=1 FL=1
MKSLIRIHNVLMKLKQNYAELLPKRELFSPNLINNPTLLWQFWLLKVMTEKHTRN